MTPAAHLQSAITLLEEIESTARPADAIISAWLRTRRRMADEDRGVILELLNNILRHRARLGWWLQRHNQEETPRNLMLVWQRVAERRSVAQLHRFFSGMEFGPEALTDAEYAFVTKLEGNTILHPNMSEDVRLECPDWASEPLRRRFGEAFEAEMEALLTSPTLDLRVNTLKTTRELMLKDLKERGLPAERTWTAPHGIRLQERLALSRIPALRTGELEIQDEGSQMVARLVDARPGDRVVDFCAGAGGKTLAIAAQMNNKGHIIACDVNEGRLKRASERMRHAGVHNAQTRLLSSESDKWVKRHKLSYDRVLVDAPCSGTGTWRRNPDARWRSADEKGLDHLVALQARILASAARLVKPGGRLVYATCSMLLEENDLQVQAFLAAHPQFSIVPMREAAPKWTAFAEDDFLSLTPGQNDTDGFFAAVLQRAEEPAPASAE